MRNRWLGFTVAAVAWLGFAADEAAAGPFVGISPMIGSFGVEMRFRRPGTIDVIEADESLTAWSFEAGWRWSRRVAVGLERTASKGTTDGRGPGYEHTLVRTDWSPTEGPWWLSLAWGFASVQGRMTAGPSGTLYPRSGGGVVLAAGAGGDLALARSWALRGRVEWLRERGISSDNTDLIDTDGWCLGISLVWRPRDD